MKNDHKRYAHSILSIAILVSLFALPQDALAEAIRELKTTIAILPSGNAEAVEDLKIDFGPAGKRNQFFRIFPTWYEPNDVDHKVELHVQNVTMDNGQQVPFESWPSGRELYLTVGDQDEPFRGEHTFKIQYEILNAVHFAGATPRVLLSATGEQSPFPVDHAVVSVTPPKGTDLSRVKASSSLGDGKEPTPGTVGDGQINFEASNIPPAQGMTISMELPSGSVVPHSVLHQLMWYLQKCYQFFALPVVTIMILSIWWWFYGRDPGAEKEKDPLDWRPPDYLSPAEVGTLIDERCDLSDVVSTLIDLAARGFINIKVIPYNGFLYMGNRDYEFTLLKSPRDRELKPHEQMFLAALFGYSDTNYASAIKGSFAEYLPIMRQRVYSSLVIDGIFARDPEIDRRNFIAVGAAVVTVGIGLMLASSYHTGGQATALGTILSGIILILAARAMPRRTSRGVTALAQLRRFRDAMASDKKEDVEKFAKDEPDAFNKFLSYAIVLGIADQWVKVCSHNVKDYPSWYQVDASFAPERFVPQAFLAELGEGLTIITRALTEVESAGGATRTSLLVRR